MTDELVKRLRSMHWCVTTEANGVGVSDRKVASEAADHIKALTAERDRLSVSNMQMLGDIAVAMGRIEALIAERDEALWQAECAKDTLSAWFDRRELGHEAVDQAVVDAASGYLRTSRVGGMPRKQSDLIIGVIQDMARLGLFADLFARAALKGETP